jgi:hypothetical protein
MHIRIRNLVNPESGMKEVGSGIWVNHLGSATLRVVLYIVGKCLLRITRVGNNQM